MALYYISGPQEDAQAQALVSQIIGIDEGTYYMTLAAKELIDRAQQIPAALRTYAQNNILALESEVDNIIASYNARQSELKNSSWLDDVTQAIRNGWQAIAAKFSASVNGHIGVFPIAVAVVAAIVVAGGATAYIITELAETKRKAETDQYRIGTALDSMMNVPGVEAGDITSLLSSLPNTPGSESSFDKIIDLAKWGLLAGLVIFGFNQFKKAKA